MGKSHVRGWKDSASSGGSQTEYARWVLVGQAHGSGVIHNWVGGVHLPFRGAAGAQPLPPGRISHGEKRRERVRHRPTLRYRLPSARRVESNSAAIISDLPWTKDPPVFPFGRRAETGEKGILENTSNKNATSAAIGKIGIGKIIAPAFQGVGASKDAPLETQKEHPYKERHH